MSIYLDSAATTPVSDKVMECIIPYFQEKFYNPSANYTPSFNVLEDINNAKANIASYFNCQQDRIYFTSGASESNSWAMQGWLRLHTNGVIITTNIEHPSIMNIANDPYYSDRIKVIPVGDDGVLSSELLDNQMDYIIGCGVRPRDILVAIQYANNEIGTIQNIPKLSELAHDRGATFFTDATQAFSDEQSRNLFIRAPHINMLSMSGHKIGAPKGIGILFSTVDLPPLIYGSQNGGMRGGTENVAGIIGLGEAFRQIQYDNYNAIRNTRDKILKGISEMTPVKVNGATGTNRLSNNLNITFENRIFGTTIMSVLSALETYVSIGSACSAQSQEMSHVLRAIGLTEEEALKTIRITIPDTMREYDVDPVLHNFRIAIELLLKNR